MPEPKIVFAPILDDEVRAIGEGLVPKGFDLQWTAHADVPDAIQDADFLCGFVAAPLATEVLVSAAANRLKLVQLMSVGYDRFNLDGAREAKLPVAVNGGANAIAVAEHAIMMMLATLKRVHELDAAVRVGGWRSASHSDRVYELWHSTVGIVGMGRIGQEVATRLAGWEANIVYYDPFRLTRARERELGVKYVELDELLRTSDVVTVHVPLNAQTRHLIDAESLSIMKSTSVLVNTARGELVDELALIDALREGRILGAGLDVLSQEPPDPTNPIFELKNVLLTPHTAGPTWQSFPRRFENCFANIERVQKGEKAQWVVPELADLFE
jgi:phosphoglycerate dehydrogenase-like enzyme